MEPLWDAISIFAGYVSEFLDEMSLRSLAARTHSQCLRLAPTRLHEIHTALICGANTLPTHVRTDFINSGLIHVVVVSGGHLVLASRGLSIIRAPRWLQMSLMTLWTLATDLQPPCVRALLALTLAPYRLVLGWSSLELQVAASLLCLLGAPQWWYSWSWQLSSVAAVAVSCGGSAWARQARVSLSLAPLLAGTSLSIYHLLINLLLAETLAAILIPLSLSCFVWDPGIFSTFWHGLLTGLSELPQTHMAELRPPGFWGGVYFLLTALLLRSRSASEPAQCLKIPLIILALLLPVGVGREVASHWRWRQASQIVERTPQACRFVGILPSRAPKSLRSSCAQIPWVVEGVSQKLCKKQRHPSGAADQIRCLK